MNDSFSMAGVLKETTMSIEEHDVESALDQSMFDMLQECNDKADRDISCKVVEYYPSVFEEIRRRTGVSDHCLVKSFDPDVNLRKLALLAEQNKGGASGAFIYSTSDELLFVKTITQQEKYILLETMLHKYVQRIQSNDTLLARILGVYMIQITGNYATSIVVMQSASFNSQATCMKFDLKGSTFNRRVLKDCTVSPLYNTLLKDQDFASLVKTLRLSSQSREDFLRRVASDVKMLVECDIMDYSLLVTIGNNLLTDPGHKYLYSPDDCTQTCYSIAIIDITQRYTWAKAAENGFKRVVSKATYDQVSSVNVALYSRRFLEMCDRIA
jgi:hypothetical protein